MYKLLEIFSDWLEKLDRRKIIHDREGNEPYMIRHYLLFKNRPNWFPFNVVLHKVLLSDEDGIHCHPWKFFTIILKGGYWETYPVEKNWKPNNENPTPPITTKVWRSAGIPRFRKATYFHKLEIDKEKAKGETWTLFFMGKREKDWGFIDDDGRWVQWEQHIANRRKYKYNQTTGN